MNDNLYQYDLVILFFPHIYKNKFKMNYKQLQYQIFKNKISEKYSIK